MDLRYFKKALNVPKAPGGLVWLESAIGARGYFLVLNGLVVVVEDIDPELDRICRTNLKDSRLDGLRRESVAIDECPVG